MSVSVLDELIERLYLPGLHIRCRMIEVGDEGFLLREEHASIAATNMGAKRASGSARRVARELLAELGFPGFPIRKGAGGEPIWPQGVSGSLAHDATVAIAAVGWTREVGSIGIDIEPVQPLAADLIDLVMTTKERALLDRIPFAGTIVFAAKEAVYKAVYPLDQRFLEYDDIDVDLEASMAFTRSGRRLALWHSVGVSHIAVLAQMYELHSRSH